jgi:hypothetical protein
MEEAKKFYFEFTAKHPHLKEQVDDLFSLMEMEVSEGASESNEAYLFIDSCKQLLEN